jgi:hypothetical protein
MGLAECADVPGLGRSRVDERSTHIVTGLPRIGLRLLGVVLLVGSIAAVVFLIDRGPTGVAEWMGKSCAHSGPSRGSPEQCDILDVVQIYWLVPILFVIGFALTLSMRPADRGPITIDLRRFRRR